MDHKAQIITKPIIYIAIAIIGGVLLFSGVKMIYNISQKSKQIEYDNFISSLQNGLEAQRMQQVGSLKDMTFSVPRDIDLICFFDDANDIRAYRNNEVAKLKANYPEYNVFFSPHKTSPEKLEFLGLQDDENPLCVKPINGKITLGLQSAGRTTEVTSLIADTIKEDCTTVLYNGDPKNKIDLVFLGYGYDENEDFNKDVNNYINNVLFEVVPFKGNRDKFNIFRIDNAGLDCQVGGFISCGSYEVKVEASRCPNDYIFVLVNRNKVLDLVTPVRSSAVGNMGKINTADKDFVIVHEFGHMFPIVPLADEYVDQYYESVGFNASEYPNCDNVPCSKWDEITNNCIQGCSQNRYFRSNQTSIMKELKSHFFGAVNEKELLMVLEAYE